MSCTRRAVRIPSTIMFVPSVISFAVLPSAIIIPAVWLRLWTDVQVQTRSPIPERPKKVVICAPKCTPKRVISTSPRVMRAARLLSPRPMPSSTPQASAMIFFSAPPYSTPLISSLRYTRKTGLMKRSCTTCTASGTSDAATVAHGSPRPTSSAWFGPERTTIFFVMSFTLSLMTSDRR